MIRLATGLNYWRKKTVSRAVKVGIRMLVRCLVVSIVILAFQACTGAQNFSLVRTELFFGLNKPGGSIVAANEWQAFVDTCITPAFRSGFTVVDGYGQWQNEAGEIEKERSKILILLHPADATNAHLIEYVRNTYKAAFGQESVLRVTMPVDASF